MVIAELLNEIEKNKKAKQDRAIYLEQKIQSAFSDYC
jgi:transglutaminase-like putative cysteine protease